MRSDWEYAISHFDLSPDTTLAELQHALASLQSYGWGVTYYDLIEEVL